MSDGQFDTPEKMKEFRKAEIAQLEADCSKQESEGYTEDAAKNKAMVERLKSQYRRKYGEDI